MLTRGLASSAGVARPVAAGWQPLLALGLALMLLPGWSIHREFDRQREQAGSRLEAQAEVYAAQVEHWLSQQMALARFIGSGTRGAELMARWQARQDPADLRTLLGRAAAFNEELGGEGVLLFDAQARLLAPGTGGLDDGGETLGKAVREAVATGKPVHTGLYRRDASPASVHIDFVVPMARAGLPTAGAIAVRIDARRVLFPMLARWPGKSTSGEAVLWRIDGERIALLSDARHLPDKPGQISEPWRTSTVATGPACCAETSKPVKSWRRPTTAAPRCWPPSSPWRAATGCWSPRSTAPRSTAPAWRSAALTGAVALLAWCACALGLRLWLQQRALLQSRHDHKLQRQQLQTMTLLQALAQSSSDAIFVKNLQGAYQLYNRAACEEIGKTVDECWAARTVTCSARKPRRPCWSNDRQALAATSPQVFEEHIPTPRGVLTKLCTKGPLRDDEGQVIGVFGISRDVTQARLAERALHDSDAHYRAVVSVLNEGIVVIDPQGRMISCNPAAERIVGSPQSAWQGQSVVAPGWQVLRPDGSVVPPEETPPGRVLAGAGPQRAVLLQTRDPQGVPLWFELSAQPVISDDDGQLIAVVSSFHDVTQRKLQDDELERHRERLEELVAERTQQLQATYSSMEEAARFNRAITDRLPARVTYWDADLRCRFVNQTYLSWHGQSAEEVLGHTMPRPWTATTTSRRCRTRWRA